MNTYARKVTVPLVVAILLFCVSAFFAVGRDMLSAEKVVFEFINNWPNELAPLFILITYLGSKWMAAGLCLILLVIRNFRLLLRVIIIGAATYVLIEAIKLMIARPRPIDLLNGVITRGVAETGYGFPSGHTAITTALGLTLFWVLPGRLRWLVLPWIAGVALSRIYLGVHSPLDIVGGLTVGTIVALGPLLFISWLRPKSSKESAEAD